MDDETGSVGWEPDVGATGDTPSDDVLADGPRHRLPRWVLLVVSGLVAVVVAAAVVTYAAGPGSHGSHKTATARPVAAAPAPPPSASPVAPPQGEVLPVGPVASAVDGSGIVRVTATAPGPMEFVPASTYAAALGGIDPSDVDSAVRVGQTSAEAITLDGDDILVLQPCRLVRLGQSPLAILKTRSVVCEVGDPAYGPWRLIATGTRLWAVGLGSAHAYSIDPVTLVVGSIVTAPSEIEDAAGLDGHLYLDTTTGVFDVAGGSTHAERIAGLSPAQQIVADPTRHRLVLRYADSAAANTLLAYQPGAAVDAQVPRTLPWGFGDLGIADGQIWFGGAGDPTAPIVTRLDPGSLTPLQASPVRAQLTAQAEFVGAGAADLWVRSAGTSSGLWCVAANTGAVAQQWGSLPGLVVSRAGAAFVASGSVVAHLRLNSQCLG